MCNNSKLNSRYYSYLGNKSIFKFIFYGFNFYCIDKKGLKFR